MTDSEKLKILIKGSLNDIDQLLDSEFCQEIDCNFCKYSKVPSCNVARYRDLRNHLEKLRDSESQKSSSILSSYKSLPDF